MEQFNNVIHAHERTVQAQLQMQRTLQEEKEINQRLLKQLGEVDEEKRLLEKIVEQHEVQTEL